MSAMDTMIEESFMATKVDKIVGVTLAMLALATIAVALRCYVRIHIIKSVALEDYFVIVSLAAFFVSATFTVWGTIKGGLGHHFAVLNQEKIEHGAKSILFIYLGYVVSVCFFKNSICLLLMKLDRQNKLHVWTLRATMLGTVVTGIFGFLWMLFQCYPVSYFWNTTPTRIGHCRSSSRTVISIYVFSIVDIVIDWIYALLPLRMILRLQMNTPVKISLICLLCIGFLASVATIARCAYIHSVNNAADYFWAYNNFLIWSNAEVGLGIATACMTTLKPLLGRFAGRRNRSLNPGQYYPHTPQRSSAVRSRDPFWAQHGAEADMSSINSKDYAEDDISQSYGLEESNIEGNYLSTSLPRDLYLLTAEVPLSSGTKIMEDPTSTLVEGQQQKQRRGSKASAIEKDGSNNWVNGSIP